MANDNILTQIRQAFSVPDSVVFLTPAINIISKSNIGSQEQKFDETANITPYAGDTPLYISAMGTPVFSNIEFLSDTYETNTKGLFRDTPALRYDAVLLTVSQSKKIIKTEIQGRDGTVKEYIGMDDFSVTINGIITGTNGHYPVDEVALLKQILDAPIPIPVASTYLNNLGINSLVIESYEFGQEAGGYSYQTFSISAVSEIPTELRLTNV
jgi:hypothetical protein